jgi:hypothetical protein
MLGERRLKSNPIRWEIRAEIVICEGAANKKTGQRSTFGRVKTIQDYFLEQVGQVAQVAPLSVQHCMPQAAAFLDLLQQAQPVTRVAAHTRAAQRVRSFVIFIVGFLCC